MNTIERLADAIINARDFCGNENEAMIDAAADMGIKLTPEIRLSAITAANDIWRDFQRRAGVSLPISTDERREINKALK